MSGQPDPRKPEHPHGTPPGQTPEHNPPGQEKPRPDQEPPKPPAEAPTPQQ